MRGNAFAVRRYNVGMSRPCIQYRGRYEYTDSVALEHALAFARAELDDEELAEVGTWLRFFVCKGTQLTVNLTVPATAEHRFIAANMFLVLARGAIDGSVEALQGAQGLDRFVAGVEDDV